ncbi:MAG: response regulator, partial [Candidatus Binatia bacterium]
METLLPASHSKPTVLLVESDRELQTLIRLALRRSYDVVVASGPSEACKRLESDSGRIGVVLMDADAAEGVAALAGALRASAAGRELPLIATGCLSRPDEVRVIASGCDSYLSKPFYPRELLSLLEQYVP